MEKMKLFAWAFVSALLTLSVGACSDDDSPATPQPEEGTEEAVADYFDIWVRAGSGSERASLVKNVETVGNPSTVIDFRNSGADVTATLDEETIFKGGYYYQIPRSGDRFGKYRIWNGKLTTVKERPFEKNTYSTYRYTHAWTDDHTLVIMAASGDKKRVIWTKLNTDDMSIIAEGDLGLTIDDDLIFSTSGLARYRSDGYIIYLTQRKSKFVDDHFFAIFIKASDMTVRNEVKETRAQVMAGTAYGELLQDKMFFDENEDLYVACNTERKNADSYTEQYGQLLRIKHGEFGFDPSYLGHHYDSGKLVTATYLTTGKAILYIQDPTFTHAGGWGNNYNCYFALLDLKTDQKTELEYQGKPLPYSQGTFSQFAVVRNGKAYLATNPENEAPAIYIYDIRTGKMEKGLSVTEGYSFFRLVPMVNPNKAQ